jgi:DNA-binding beta-propeller fold protein YncE
MIAAIFTLAASIDLLGPGGRPITRQQIHERADGSSNLIEYAVAPSRFGSGFVTIRTYVTLREDGSVKRSLLSEREAQIPPENIRAAKLSYQFPVNGATAVPNRIAFLSGATELAVRTYLPASNTVGRAVAIPANARLIVQRPNSEEVYVAHSGGASQISVISTREDRLLANFQLRLNPQDSIVSLHFAGDGRLAWLVARNPDSANERGKVLVLDCAARQVINTVALGTNTPTSAALNPEGNLLLIQGTSLNASGSPEPSMLAYDTITNTSAQLTLGAANLSTTIPSEMLWHPDGARLYWLQPSTSTIDQYEVGARRVTRRIAVPRTSILQSMDLSSTGDYAIVRDTNGTLSYWLDLESGENLDATPIPAGLGFLLPRFP